MATPEDLAANADYIRMADKYVEVCLITLQLTAVRLESEAKRKVSNINCVGPRWHQQQQLRQRRAHR